MKQDPVLCLSHSHQNWEASSSFTATFSIQIQRHCLRLVKYRAPQWSTVWLTDFERITWSPNTQSLILLRQSQWSKTETSMSLDQVLSSFNTSSIWNTLRSALFCPSRTRNLSQRFNIGFTRAFVQQSRHFLQNFWNQFSRIQKKVTMRNLSSNFFLILTCARWKKNYKAVLVYVVTESLTLTF